MGITLMLLAAVCAFIQSTVGFGFNIMYMAAGPYFMEYGLAQVMCFCGTSVGNVANVLPRIKKINIRQVIVPTISYCIFTFISIRLTMGLETELLRKLLGILLFALSIYFVFFSGKITIKPTALNSIIAGAISGVGGGIFAINGPPMVVYYLSALNDKEEYMATIQTFFFITSIATIAIKVATGTFEIMQPLWFLFTAAGVVIGAFVGMKTYKRLNANAVRLCVYAFMALSGLWIFIS